MLLLGGDNKFVCCIGIALHVLIGKYLDFNAWLDTVSHLYPICPIHGKAMIILALVFGVDDR